MSTPLDAQQFNLSPGHYGKEAPELPGVFCLWSKGHLVDIDVAPKSLRQSIPSARYHGIARKDDKADGFSFEVTSEEQAMPRCAELVAEYYRQTNRLPIGLDLSYRFP